MTWIFLFVLGLIIGSFLNVIALRYQEDGSLLGRRIGGRSACMTCRVNLKWYELVPLFSFLMQGAKCRHCKHSLNWQYPIVELTAAILTVALPWQLYAYYGMNQVVAHGGSLVHFYVLCALWLLAAYTTIVLSAIDFRLRIIPDQCNLLLGAIGLVLIGARYVYAQNIISQNWTGPYASMLGAPANPFLSALVALLFVLAFFGGIIYFSRGRGMGLGDLKLAIPMALLLGWPDTLVATLAAFILGTALGISLLAQRKIDRKAAIPFGPFIVLGMYVAIFYGEAILRWYFSLV